MFAGWHDFPGPRLSLTFPQVRRTYVLQSVYRALLAKQLVGQVPSLYAALSMSYPLAYIELGSLMGMTLLSESTFGSPAC